MTVKYTTQVLCKTLVCAYLFMYCNAFELFLSLLIGEAIKSFFCLFDKYFTGIGRTLKMHILEDHMLEWVSTHLAGCGLMGEQGAESIHSKFNSLKRTYSGISEILLLGLKALCKTITLAFRHTCQLQYQHLKKEEYITL